MHFPFHGTYQFGMGIRPLTEMEPLLVCDSAYQKEIVLKRGLLIEDNAYYFQAQNGTELAQWEVLELLLNNLTHFYPSDFALLKEGKRWIWQNNLLAERVEFIFGDAGSLPCAPLDWVGRQVQEDLLLVNEQAFLVAGQLCFPSGWTLDEKIGQSFLGMHAPLPPALDPMLSKAEQLMSRILAGKPLQRSNWGLRLTDQLDLSTRHSKAYAAILERANSIGVEEILEKVFLRTEHQTLSRLPLSHHVLFTVHTFIERLDKVLDTSDKVEQAFHYLQSVPKEVLEYKAVWPFYGKLMERIKVLI